MNHRPTFITGLDGLYLNLPTVVEDARTDHALNASDLVYLFEKMTWLFALIKKYNYRDYKTGEMSQDLNVMMSESVDSRLVFEIWIRQFNQSLSFAQIQDVIMYCEAVSSPYGNLALLIARQIRSDSWWKVSDDMSRRGASIAVDGELIEPAIVPDEYKNWRVYGLGLKRGLYDYLYAHFYGALYSIVPTYSMSFEAESHNEITLQMEEIEDIEEAHIMLSNCDKLFEPGFSSFYNIPWAQHDALDQVKWYVPNHPRIGYVERQVLGVSKKYEFQTCFRNGESPYDFSVSFETQDTNFTELYLELNYYIDQYYIDSSVEKHLSTPKHIMGKVDSFYHCYVETVARSGYVVHILISYGLVSELLSRDGTILTNNYGNGNRFFNGIVLDSCTVYAVRRTPSSLDWPAELPPDD